MEKEEKEMIVEKLYWTKLEKKDKTNGKPAKKVAKSYLLAMFPHCSSMLPAREVLSIPV